MGGAIGRGCSLLEVWCRARLALVCGVCSLLNPLLCAGEPQSVCSGGVVIGMVEDQTGALIPSANVRMDGVEVARSDAKGEFRLSCVPLGKHRLHVAAPSFASSDVDLKVNSAHSDTRATVHLGLEIVEQAVNAIDPDSVLNDSSDGSKILNQDQMKGLADDPEELRRQLQTLAALGNPQSVIFSVNGFQDNATLPPKEAIASIHLNPDLFSAEYGQPLYVGSRVEIFTKPGATRLHGSLFFNASEPFMNARDPYSPSKASLGRRQYGFSATGPIHAPKTAYSLNLERRDINNFAVVNATTLDASLNRVATLANVPITQHLWVGSARIDAQLSKATFATASYSANVNSLENVGAGGLTLQDASYDSTQAEHALRLTASTTLSPHIVHESRIGLTFQNENDTPHSTLPSLNVAGFFVAGGSPTGIAANREKRWEINDDLLADYKTHSLKMGVVATTFFENQTVPTNFNGAYTFGGRQALPLDGNGSPTSTTPVFIDGVEQYRRALLAYQGGTATSYQVAAGTPHVKYTLLQTALYLQDRWKVRSNLMLMPGMRYTFQTDPGTFGNFAPRFGFSWNPPPSKKTLLVTGHIGLFASTIDSAVAAQAFRFNLNRQTSSLLYSVPLSGSGSAQPILTRYQFAPHLNQSLNWQAQLGLQYEFPGHWVAEVNGYYTRGWNTLRLRNINSPSNGDPYGPRPFAANVNLQQFQQTGRFSGDFQYLRIEQNSLKRLQVFLGYFRSSVRSNADTPSTEPQSAYSDSGEYARPSWQGTHNSFGVVTVHLPEQLLLSSIFGASSGQPFNLLTGSDNNGDGVFNDRPQYAIPSAPGAIHTRYGDLTNSGGSGWVPRNAGTLPWKVHLDLSLQRAFVLNPKAPKDSQKMLSLNVRSTNILNHTNVTAVGNVLGSSIFGIPYQAESGRRVEVGINAHF